jgi:hypothetical protein
MVYGFWKKPENLFSNVWDFLPKRSDEAYVVWKITFELNKSHEIEANKSKTEEKETPTKSLWKKIQNMLYSTNIILVRFSEKNVKFLKIP